MSLGTSLIWSHDVCAPPFFLCSMEKMSLGMFLAAAVLVFSLYFTVDAGGNSVRVEKQKYLGRLTQTRHTIGLDVTRVALGGILADKINQNSSPREQRVVRDLQVLKLDHGGHFSAVVLMDSLLRGLECCRLEGVVGFSDLSALITNWESRNIAVCEDQFYRKTAGWSEPNINNGSKGISELLKLAMDTVGTHCKTNILDECDRGTVTMDTWVNKTLAFQRWLALNTPINEIQMLGTHNSFNDKADGYGTGDFTLGEILEFVSGGKWTFVWAQQWFTMTDQLNMGVRHLMLDPVYFWGDMRLCHCGTTFKWFDEVLDFLEKVFNTTFQFDSHDLGCMPYDRTFEAGIQEISDWVRMPGHENEFVMVLVNDEGHDADWGHLDLIQNPIAEILGDLLFTPKDKEHYFNNSWPTPNQIFELGKRVIITCGERCTDDYIFEDMTVPGWDKDTMKYFTPYPECGGYNPGDWYLVGGESQIVGPIYNGPGDEGLVIRENLPYLMQCPVSVSQMDIVSPDLIGAAIWSWANGYSVDNVSTTNCAAMETKQQGRWITLPCDTTLYHACRSDTNSTVIQLSRQLGTWSQDVCPSGFTFFLPVTGYQNWWLYQVMLKAKATQIWIDLQ